MRSPCSTERSAPNQHLYRLDHALRYEPGEHEPKYHGGEGGECRHLERPPLARRGRIRRSRSEVVDLPVHGPAHLLQVVLHAVVNGHEPGDAGGVARRLQAYNLCPQVGDERSEALDQLVDLLPERCEVGDVGLARAVPLVWSISLRRVTWS